MPERWRTGIQKIAETPKRVEIVTLLSIVSISLLLILLVVAVKAGKK
jgi:hypothetical protein